MKIQIHPHCVEWAMMFQQEKARIQQAIDEQAIAVEHIGSTSIADLPAKPIIDIQIGVRSLEEFDASSAGESIIQQGYIHRVDLQEHTPFLRFFKRENSSKGCDTNLHLVEIGDPWWNRHLLFRDYLRECSPARKRYGDLKLELSLREWRDVNHYNEGKEKLVWSLEDEAFRYFKIPDAEAERYRQYRR